MGLTLYTGNRLERLADLLAQTLIDPLPDIASPDIIVVQSRGMEQWLSLSLAQRFTGCAHLDFPFPNRFLDSMYRACFPNERSHVSLSPDAVVFGLMGLFDRGLPDAAAPVIRAYLEKDTDGLKAYQLARRFADVFDQYAVFRPDMIRDWADGRGDHWQADLWRRLFRDDPDGNRAAWQQRLCRRLAAPGGDLESGLPKRVSVFGISYLPSFYLDVFRALAVRIEVNLFVLNPCAEYWADIRSEKDIERILVRDGEAGQESTPESLHLDAGHPLLSTLGILGREFFSRITGMDEIALVEAFVPPDQGSLLGQVQTDILHLHPPNADADADGSLQIHSCHSPLREVEVLHDILLRSFEEIPALAPGDILVMTPDIDTYAPLVEAVFGARDTPGQHIPYRVSDVRQDERSSVIMAFFMLLEIPRTRYAVSDVRALLENPCIRQAFGILEEDMDLLDRWIRDTSVRWGIDPEFRVEFGLPGAGLNTWRIGIRKFLLGYALSGGEQDVFQGMLPYDGFEGSEAVRFGRIISFLEALFHTAHALDRKHSIGEWGDVLRGVVRTFLQAGDTDEEAGQQIFGWIDRLETNGAESGFDGSVGARVVLASLREQCERERAGSGFLTGGVTVCSMLPMRSIPARVICLIGLNGDGFPRRDRRLGFDLMASDPRLGDRSIRNDDRYLFLESIVSARDRLVISYVGQSIRDDADLPPSVAVSELLDILVDRYGIADADIVTRHRLQAFSKAYFSGDDRLYSYAADNCIPHEADPAVAADALAPAALASDPPADLRDISIDAFCGFFRHPARFFATHRLGVGFDVPDRALEDREPHALTGLDRWKIGTTLIDSGGDDDSMARLKRRFLASGVLPSGTPGQAQFDALADDVELLRRRIDTPDGQVPPEMPVELTIDGIRLSGILGGIWGELRAEFRFGKLRPSDMVSAWIKHLLWLETAAPGGGARSRFDAEDRRICFGQVSNARERLTALVHLYRQGLQRPLPMLPEVSHDLIDHMRRTGATMDASHRRLRNVWRERLQPDRLAREDPYMHACWRHGGLLEDPEFGTVAGRIFDPMLDHLIPCIDGE